MHLSHAWMLQALHFMSVLKLFIIEECEWHWSLTLTIHNVTTITWGPSSPLFCEWPCWCRLQRCGNWPSSRTPWSNHWDSYDLSNCIFIGGMALSLPTLSMITKFCVNADIGEIINDLLESDRFRQWEVITLGTATSFHSWAGHNLGGHSSWLTIDPAGISVSFISSPNCLASVPLLHMVWALNSL